MIVAATGHRPDKLGGYGALFQYALTSFARSWLGEAKPSKVISGMALGWDQTFAKAAIQEKIPFIAAVPFVGQESRWPRQSRIDYNHLLGRAAEIAVVCEGGYSPEKMQRRNEWMVDHADLVVALWDGSKGGTKNCMQYAEKKGKRVVNLWDEWMEIANDV